MTVASEPMPTVPIEPAGAPPQWITLDGAVNVRDLGGTATGDGRTVLAHRLIRADNLQDLSTRDVRRLVVDCEVRRVVDLRTDVEVRGEGPGPLIGDRRVYIEQLSLFVEPDDVEVVNGTAGPEILPWQSVPASDATRVQADESYLAFLAQRPANVMRALRLIAQPGGATVVHCAAGKDRTGVIVALALAAVGVPAQAIVADYARSAERIEQIVARLAASPTYRADIATGSMDDHRSQPASMQRFLTALDERAVDERAIDEAGMEAGMDEAGMDERFAGARRWLNAHGWTERDQHALEAALLG